METKNRCKKYTKKKINKSNLSILSLYRNKYFSLI